MSRRIDILIVTATKVESEAVLATFLPITGPHHPEEIDGRVYFKCGSIQGRSIALTQCEMGPGGLGAAMQAAQQGIHSLRPKSVIMVGIAFGIDDRKQNIGDVLVAVQLRPYELQRVGTTEIRLRDDKPHASQTLVNMCRSADLLWKGATVRFGVVLTGAKLVDNRDFRDELLRLEPEAIGGEMEGAGIYAACHDEKVDWILIKSICDWADGNKGVDKQAHQQHAAKTASEFLFHVLRFAKPAGKATKAAEISKVHSTPPNGHSDRMVPPKFSLRVERTAAL
jgi:nucleoside phosphorylase